MGCPPAQGSFLEDLHRLHIPSLTWGAPPEVSGRPSRALRRIAGHTLSGLLAFGGCIPTIMGIMPVAKVDLLLLGALPAHYQTLTFPSDPTAISHTSECPFPRSLSYNSCCYASLVRWQLLLVICALLWST